MKERKTKIIFGLLSICLFSTLLYKLTQLPGGVILPGYFLGGIILLAVLVAALVLTGIAKLIFKPNSFLTLFTITTTIAFLVLHYCWYSPTLKIVVPRNYTGEVILVSSNVDKNILTVDTNGIGYITKWTFEKTYTPPIVVDQDGKRLNDSCAGFNSSTFWAKGTATGTSFAGKIEYLSFEIVSQNKDTLKQFNSKEFINYIDWSKLSKNK